MTNKTPAPTRSRDLVRFRSHQRKVALRTQPSTAHVIRKINAAIGAPDDFAQNDAPPQRLAYGVARIEAKLVYGQIVRGPLYAVYQIARGEAAQELTWEIDDNTVFPSALAADGSVDFGIFKNKAKLVFKRGEPGQDGAITFFTTGDRTDDARGTDLAWAGCRFVFDPDIFLGGTPKLALVARWSLVTDVRTGFFAWSQNAALVLYDYLTRDRRRGGIGLPDIEIDIESVKTAADVCDEIVDTKVLTAEAVVTATTLTSITLSEAICPFQWGDRVTLQLGPGQSLPTGLFEATDYFVIVVHDRTNEDSLAEIKLAASYAGAVLNVPITNGNLSTGFTINKTGEPRYSVGMSFEDRADKGPVIAEMVRSMAGRLLLRDGKIVFVAGAAQTSVIEIGLDEITSPIEVSPKLDAAERFNTVIGQYRSPLNLYRETDYPAVTSQTFLAADGGEQVVERFDLAYVTRSGQAQRLASIFLGQTRQETRVALSGDLRLYRARAGEVVELTVPNLGFNQREMLVTQRALSLGARDGALQLALDFQLEATDASVYAFDPETGETRALPPPVAAVPDPRVVLPPGAPQFSEQLVVTTDGQGVRNRVTIVWEESGDSFVTSYRVVFGPVGDIRFEEINEVRELQLILDSLPPANTEFRIYARNSFGNLSAPVIGFFEVRGLTDPPSSLTRFGGQIVALSVFLQWDRSIDIDVRIGGSIEVRLDPDQSVGMSSESLKIATVSGASTSAQVPFKRGTYYIRAIDEGGRPGPFSAWSTEGIAPVQRISIIANGAFTGTDGVEDEATIDEGGAAFPSTNPLNTLIVNLDDELELDIVGGEVVGQGLYFYSVEIDFNSNVRIIVETLLRATVVDLNDIWNDRTGNVNDFPSWNSLATVGQAEAEHQIRFKRLSGDYSLWQRVDTKAIFCANLQIRILATSTNGAAQIRINQAKVFIAEAEFQRTSQAGVVFAVHQARFPIMQLDNAAAANGVSHQTTFPLMTINNDLSDTDDADLLSEAINVDIIFCTSSAPPGSALLGDDLAEPQEANLTGATADAPHPAIGWFGLDKDVRTDRARYASDAFQAAQVANKNYSWVGFLTIEDADSNATFLTGPWDDDAHVSPFTNFAVRRDGTSESLAHLWFTSGSNSEFEANEDGNCVLVDNLPHWIALVRDGNDFRFFRDGVKIETDVDPSGLAANWNQSAGFGNQIVLGTRNDDGAAIGPAEAWVGLQHMNAVWSRSLSDAEVLDLVDNPVSMFGRSFFEPRRPVMGTVDNVGLRLDTALAAQDIILAHTHGGGSMYVFAFVVSDQVTADTPTVTAKWQISSVESGQVFDVTPNTDADLDTRDGLATLRVFRIVGATQGVGTITVSVSFAGSGLYKTGGAVVVDVANDGGMVIGTSSRDDDPASNPTSNAFSTLVQTPLSSVLRFHATRGAGRAFTSASEDLFQRQLFDGEVAPTETFEYEFQLDAMNRPIGGHVPMDLSWSGGGTDHAALAIEILPLDWNKPLIREFATTVGEEATAQDQQVTVNIEHRLGANRALLVIVSGGNVSGPATMTVTVTWEIAATPSGTVTDLSDTVSEISDTRAGRPGVQVFLITGGDVGDGQIEVDVDMGGGEICRAVGVTVFDMDNVGGGGDDGFDFDPVPGSSTEALITITPEDENSKVFMCSCCQIESGEGGAHTYSNGGLAQDGPPLPTLETGTSDHSHNHSVTMLNAHMTEPYTLRANWTVNNEAGTFAVEIKPPA